MSGDERPYDAVLFDLDGTLIEHEESPATAFEAACAARELDPFCRPETLRLAKRVVAAETTDLDAATFGRRVFETAGAAAGVDVDGAALASAYEAAFDPGTASRRPGVGEAVSASDSLATALLTNGPERTHAPKLDAVGLAGRFDATVFGDDVDRVKPAADPFERALAELGCDPERALKVGDSLATDVRGATALGIDAAWIPDERASVPPGEPKPTYVLPSLADLSAVIGGSRP
ncbi:HAD family hydrolase [Halovivax limisalsi]|uniref:HAD family hydrolase n=1 Tax=Halovivax limisalsi TaxID=1453760 RepID=UPI001FFD9188|nr:HAD family hydrolase [Halovivax limisalsi]